MDARAGHSIGAARAAQQRSAVGERRIESSPLSNSGALAILYQSELEMHNSLCGEMSTHRMSQRHGVAILVRCHIPVGSEFTCTTRNTEKLQRIAFPLCLWRLTLSFVVLLASFVCLIVGWCCCCCCCCCLHRLAWHTT